MRLLSIQRSSRFRIYAGQSHTVRSAHRKKKNASRSLSTSHLNLPSRTSTLRPNFASRTAPHLISFPYHASSAAMHWAVLPDNKKHRSALRFLSAKTNCPILLPANTRHSKNSLVSLIVIKKENTDYVFVCLFPGQTSTSDMFAPFNLPLRYSMLLLLGWKVFNSCAYHGANKVNRETPLSSFLQAQMQPHNSYP